MTSLLVAAVVTIIYVLFPSGKDGELNDIIKEPGYPSVGIYCKDVQPVKTGEYSHSTKENGLEPELLERDLALIGQSSR